jgi:hydrogenase/urease accessory protein HupE
MSMRQGLLALVLWVGSTLPALGDEFRPAYLQLTQLDAVTYDVLWKVPALDDATPLRLRPEFPAGTRTLTSPHRSPAARAVVLRWKIRTPGGLAGRTIAFPDLPTARVDVLVRLVRPDGTAHVSRVLPLQSGYTIPAEPGGLEVVRTYTNLGISHILLGFDHLLFVLALMLIVDGTRTLVGTITAFTVAHSITLALATLGVLDVPGPPVEALIALSIVFVAREIIEVRQGRPSLTQRAPWIVAFGFGLLHGLGFAGALAEVGLPPASVPLALLFFNVGVEVGQLTFIGVVLVSTALVRSILTSAGTGTPSWISRVSPYAIGGTAAYWVVERVASF